MIYKFHVFQNLVLSLLAFEDFCVRLGLGSHDPRRVEVMSREDIAGPAFAAADQTWSERTLALCMLSCSLPPSNEFKCLQFAEG